MACRGDTKPLCQQTQAGVAFIGASLLPISDGKTLLLCQVPWTIRCDAWQRRRNGAALVSSGSTPLQA
jgi:hypothetical protein